jgi:hypothetical protein
VEYGSDGYELLARAYASQTAERIRMLPAVQVLRRAWVQQFYRDEFGLAWRTADTHGLTACQCVDRHALRH